MGRRLRRLVRRGAEYAADRLSRAGGVTWPSDESAAQKVLMNQYRLLAAAGRDRLPPWREVGFRKYSQFEEDGLLLFIFSLVPPINRKCVELCAGDGRQCNTANLIINHGWWGFLFEGDEDKVKTGVDFYARNRDTFLHPPRFTRAWITAENVNEVLERSGVCGPVDLLSLDLDGMDYWVWKAITAVQPQVVVCETHNLVPAGKALAVPYDPKFVCRRKDYRGASLAAMCKLGREKGYRLIGTHRFGFNAFFLKFGVGEEFFPEVDPASCANDPYSKSVREKGWPEAAKLKWQEV
jgi:hypothetical protein